IVLLPLDRGLHVSRRHQPHRMPKRLQFARPMMRCRAGLHTNEARRHFLEEREDVATLQLTAEDHLAIGVNAVHLKTRLGDVETDCLNCLHVWLLSIVGALTAPTFMALARRWRSRPQHQKRTLIFSLRMSALCHFETHAAQQIWRDSTHRWRERAAWMTGSRQDERFAWRTNQFVGTRASGILMPISR